MRAAQIDQNGVVVNYAEVAAFNGVFIDPLNSVLGSIWNGSSFTNPTVTTPIPQQVTAFQAKAALLNAGMLASINSYMNSTASPIDQLAWQETTTFNRNDLIIQRLMVPLGLTSAELDTLFIAAALINQ